MKINIKSLLQGTQVFEFKMSASELGVDSADVVVKSVGVKSTVSRNEQNVYVDSRVSAEVGLVCDSCLTEFVDTLEDRFSVYYTPDEESATNDDEQTIQILKPGMGEIDLSVGVRESILLSIPMKIVCSPDCKGLCAHCGANLNDEPCTCGRKTIDPRWEVLKGLVDKASNLTESQ